MDLRFFAGLVLLLGMGCYIPDASESTQEVAEDLTGIIKVNLSEAEDGHFQVLRQRFKERNPGYDLAWISGSKTVQSSQEMRVLFVQIGGGTATLTSGAKSKISVGDILMIKPGIGMSTDSVISYLSFEVPEIPQEGIPTFIRPDWDENITDTPGGCATETGAYRRILLTWLGKVGPYLFHSLNAHRVRIMDSFTHYHPVEGGFDEFYLVQMVQPEARLISSPFVEEIEHFEDLNQEEAATLLSETPLGVGDLVYIPRGIAHRGIGGVLAQVITIPGFKPRAEIGLDYHLRRLNQHLNLATKDTLPYHFGASDSIVIK